MKKIFITGGAGYVGAVLVPHLLSLDYSVTVLDLMIYGDVLEPHPNLKLIKGDIRDQKLLMEEIEGHEAVIHLACISNDPSFELNPQLGKSINLDSFEPLVKISKELGLKRFIYASSSSVYGIKQEANVHEGMALEPLTDYSLFKAQCEEILSKYQDKSFTTVTIRPATVCGYSPRQRLDVVVNILTNFAHHKGEINVLGGEQLRPNIHIQDMVNAYVLLLTAPANEVAGEIFNAGGDNFSVNEIASKVRDVIGQHIKINIVPSNDDRSYHISSKKILDKLGFKTKHTIEDAVSDLQTAFKSGLLLDTFNDEKYFNIKRMQKLELR
jgi:nucleoside-diphosphate-sugar epimerase